MSVDSLAIRRRLGRHLWSAPRPFGPDGWMFLNRAGTQSMAVSVAVFDGAEWVHASVAGRVDMPVYGDLAAMHRAVFRFGPGGAISHACQVFVPEDEHVNLHERALHLWGRADGARVLPDFSSLLPSGVRSV